MKIDALILEAKHHKLKQDYMELRENEALNQVCEHYRADKKIVELLEEKDQKVQEAIKKDEAEFDKHLATFEEEYADFYELDRSREKHKEAMKEKAKKEAEIAREKATKMQEEHLKKKAEEEKLNKKKKERKQLQKEETDLLEQKHAHTKAVDDAIKNAKDEKAEEEKALEWDDTVQQQHHVEICVKSDERIDVYVYDDFIEFFASVKVVPFDIHIFLFFILEL